MPKDLYGKLNNFINDYMFKTSKSSVINHIINDWINDKNKAMQIIEDQSSGEDPVMSTETPE